MKSTSLVAALSCLMGVGRPSPSLPVGFPPPSGGCPMINNMVGPGGHQTSVLLRKPASMAQSILNNRHRTRQFARSVIAAQPDAVCFNGDLAYMEVRVQYFAVDREYHTVLTFVNEANTHYQEVVLVGSGHGIKPVVLPVDHRAAGGERLR